MSTIRHEKSILLFVILATLALLNLTAIFSQSYEDRWLDADWHYRIGLEINSTGYNRWNWSVEYGINFTAILSNMSVYDAFDENSTRVIEYNSSGSVIGEVPSQFDKGESYNETTNAFGTIVFFMNGTTQANQKRYFYIYFDTLQHGIKSKANYTTDLYYNYTGNVSEFNINNSFFRWWIATEMGENTSGIRNVTDVAYENDILKWNPSDNRSVEYSEFSNATNRFGFDFRNNATLKYAGSVRIVVEQKGDEMLWGQPDNKTGEGYMIKRYTFYRNADWIKIEQTFVNNASYNITRNSTAAGALALYVNYSFSSSGSYSNMSNTVDPGSYAWASEETGTWWMGIVNAYENGTGNFFALEDDQTGRIGIQLNQTTIPNKTSINHMAVIQFNTNGTMAEDRFRNFVNQSITPINITTLNAEAWTVTADKKFYINATSEAYVFNRNESVTINANVTDFYNLSKGVNASLDLGGAGELNITLYDDGSHGDGAANDSLYADTYNLSDSASTGVWNVTFRVYNQSWHLLNLSSKTFNVTNIYNVTVNISNPTGFTDRLMNATVYVRNYRKDRWITGATLDCTSNSQQIPQGNITDNGDGMYDVRFGAPSYAGLFTLACNATRNNNTGSDSEEFTCETFVTNVSITPTPQNFTANNVTFYSNQTLNITVVAENTANGTAYNMNITLNFLNPNITANTTFALCGDVLISKNCTKTFQIIVLNATPQGNYSVNITSRWNNWVGYPEGYNYTIFNVTVLPNPMLNVSTNYVLGIISIGKAKNISNFSIYSLGNEPLQNLIFNVSGFSSNFTFVFTPPNLSSLGPGNSQNVVLQVNTTNNTVAGEYNGTINVTTANDGFRTINLILAVAGTNMTIYLDKYNFTAENVTWYQGQTFPLLVNTTNIGNSTAYNVSIKLNFSSGNITSNVTSYSCGSVPKSATCNTSFLINITKQTHSGNYTVNVSVQWEDPDQGTSFNITTLNITVLSHINMSIPQDSLATNVTHGTEKQLGVIILNSTGNDPVENITFTSFNFSSGFYFSTVPPNITSLGGEYPQGVKVNVTVRYGQPPGVYTGILNVTSGNGGYKEINLTVEVPVSRTWTMNTTYCERAESPEEGKVCDVFVNNTGNVIVNFSITPVTSPASMLNFTWTNETGFVLGNGTGTAFTVYYNITGQTIKFYYANYTVNAIQSDASPDYQILQIVLNPFIKPTITVGISPNKTEQTEYVWIYANVTDQSGAGIEDGNVTVTVRRPDGSSNTITMFFYGGLKTGGTSRWRARYYSDNDLGQGVWGNTTNKGYYNVSVYAIDNQAKNDTVNGSFFIYSKLSPFFMTTLPYYYQSGPGKPVIFYKSLDFSNDILPHTNVTFVINNSNGTVYNSSTKYGNLTTGSDGYVRDEYGGYLLDTRDLAGYPLGNYTVTAYSTYYEPNASAVVTDVSAYTFQLLRSGGVFANILVYPVWYPAEGIVKFKMWVTDGTGNLTDPASMNLTVTMPITGNPFFNKTMADMTKISDGVYTYTYNLPSNPSPGVYEVTLKVLGWGVETYAFSAFRIGIGGPYDVKITSMESTVYQNDYLDFTLYIKNMGDAPTENHVEYWVTDLNNTPLEYADYYEQLGAGVEKSEPKSLYIWNSHPVGNYILKVVVTYANSTYANASAPFSVTQGGAPQPPGGAPGGAAPAGAGAVAPGGPPKIEITKYPQELGMEQDSSKYQAIEVKNSGGTTLYNISLRITGIPSPWIQDISPKKIDFIPVGNLSTFTVTFKIPPMAEAKEYAGRIIADANVTSDEKSFSLTIFTTRAELVRWEIDSLKKALQQFEVDVENAKKIGKNVNEVLPYINQVKEQINLAEDYLQKKMYDDSLSAVHTGLSALEKARYLLAQAPFTQILIETIFPPWLIAVFVVMAIVIVVLLVFVRRMKGVFDRIFRMQAPGGAGVAKSSVVVEKMKERESMDREEVNIRRVLGLIEREYKEGLISENAYNDLKKRNEEKLAKIQERKTAIK